MNTDSIVRCAVATGLVLLLSACVIDPTHVEKDFGNSVRQMVAAQIAYPEVASNPDPNGPDLLDGVAADTSVEAYREDFKRKRDDPERLSIVFE